MTQAPVVKKHIVERFLDWFPFYTKLYIRGEKNADWTKTKRLEKELFDALMPFFEEYKNEIYEEIEQKLKKKYCQRFLWATRNVAKTDDDIVFILRLKDFILQ
jgi:hypothetical protein